MKIRCYRCGKIGYSLVNCKVPWENINNEKKEKTNEKKEPPYNKRKTNEYAHYIVSHYNFNVDNVFNTAYSS